MSELLSSINFPNVKSGDVKDFIVAAETIDRLEFVSTTGLSNVPIFLNGSLIGRTIANLWQSVNVTGMRGNNIITIKISNGISGPQFTDEAVNVNVFGTKILATIPVNINIQWKNSGNLENNFGVAFIIPEAAKGEIKAVTLPAGQQTTTTFAIELARGNYTVAGIIWGSPQQVRKLDERTVSVVI